MGLCLLFSGREWGAQWSAVLLSPAGLRCCYCVGTSMRVEKLKWKEMVWMILAKNQFLMCHCLFHWLIPRVKLDVYSKKRLQTFLPFPVLFIVACWSLHDWTSLCLNIWTATFLYRCLHFCACAGLCTWIQVVVYNSSSLPLGLFDF